MFREFYHAEKCEFSQPSKIDLKQNFEILPTEYSGNVL